MTRPSNTDRRRLLKGLAAASVMGAMPRLSLAAGTGDARFVLIVLRGALDGLALLPPVGDPNYARVRKALAFGQAGGDALTLDGQFGLNPAMPKVHAMYQQREALMLHAIASPYRARSHFDGQDILESGAAGNLTERDGWLNRALALPGQPMPSMALAHTVPLVLRGDAPVSSWAPSRLPDASDDTLRRLANLYANDAFFAKQLEEAMTAQAIAERAGVDAPRKGNALRDTLTKAAAFLSSPDGARIAVTDVDGWDTHANQGVDTGTLANRLRALDQALDALRAGLGEYWQHTVVAVVTEFGRTVRPNGTRGTDHGTGAAAMLLGGAVRGGRVEADWPGLRDGDLYAGRDLMPTRDLRSVFKSVLVAHLGLDVAGVDARVFANSVSARVEPAWFA